MTGGEIALRRSRLARYGDLQTHGDRDDQLYRFASFWVAACLGLGVVLSLFEVTRRPIAVGATEHRVTIELSEMMPPPPMAEPAPEPATPVIEPETVLAQPVDRPRERPEPVVAAQTATVQAPAPDPEPARRVYGVRRVYARGLGAGGDQAAALVTKLGNTVDGRRDDLTATAADLQGELAALSSVETAPEPVRRVRPLYSEALTKARAEGLVEAYLLIDVDGKVRDVKIVSDFGFDSAAVAEAALRKFEFIPARRAGKPVAVWILHRIRFEFQE